MRSMGSEKGHRMPLGKPTPSKWDDAQKWLVNLSGAGDKNKAKASPRNSNADDRRLITAVPKEYWNGEEEGETKNIDWAESIWRNNSSLDDESASKSICLRDMGTEMTPIASQEPSRSATPVRGGNAAGSRSHKSSRSSTPVRCLNEQRGGPNMPATPGKEESSRPESDPRQLKEKEQGPNGTVDKINNECKESNPMEARAAAWDEAERAKYMARYKREEVKIQSWENHEKRKAEMEYGKVEAEAERLKSGAQEEYKRKVATTQRRAEEKRAAAEAKLKEKIASTCERADYIRTSGHLPQSCLNFFPFNFKPKYLTSWSFSCSCSRCC